MADIEAVVEKVWKEVEVIEGGDPSVKTMCNPDLLAEGVILILDLEAHWASPGAR
jgi:hypothetical protein